MTEYLLGRIEDFPEGKGRAFQGRRAHGRRLSRQRPHPCHLSASGDIALTERKLESGELALKKLPSQYILDHVRFSTQPITIPKNRKHFAWMLELCHAEDLFCFSSDWPHRTMDPANWVVESTDCIDDEMQKKILSGNARKLYGRL